MADLYTTISSSYSSFDSSEFKSSYSSFGSSEFKSSYSSFGSSELKSSYYGNVISLMASFSTTGTKELTSFFSAMVGDGKKLTSRYGVARWKVANLRTTYASLHQMVAQLSSLYKTTSFLPIIPQSTHFTETYGVLSRRRFSSSYSHYTLRNTKLSAKYGVVYERVRKLSSEYGTANSASLAPASMKIGAFFKGAPPKVLHLGKNEKRMVLRYGDFAPSENVCAVSEETLNILKRSAAPPGTYVDFESLQLSSDISRAGLSLSFKVRNKLEMEKLIAAHMLRQKLVLVFSESWRPEREFYITSLNDETGTSHLLRTKELTSLNVTAAELVMLTRSLKKYEVEIDESDKNMTLREFCDKYISHPVTFREAFGDKARLDSIVIDVQALGNQKTQEANLLRKVADSLGLALQTNEHGWELMRYFPIKTADLRSAWENSPRRKAIGVVSMKSSLVSPEPYTSVTVGSVSEEELIGTFSYFIEEDQETSRAVLVHLVYTEDFRKKYDIELTHNYGDLLDVTLVKRDEIKEIEVPERVVFEKEVASVSREIYEILDVEWLTKTNDVTLIEKSGSRSIRIESSSPDTPKSANIKYSYLRTTYRVRLMREYRQKLLPGILQDFIVVARMKEK